jgi:outer membrane protein assembly factor BamB
MKLKRLLFTLASFVFSCSFLWGQGGFNVRIPREAGTVFQSIYCAIDTSYIISGWSIDESLHDHLDFQLMKFDQYGATLQASNFNTPACSVGIMEDSGSQVQGYYMQIEQSLLNGNYAYQLFYFNENLDTLFTTKIQSPYADSMWIDSDFMQYEYAIVAMDTSTFIAHGIYHPVGINDICIKKLSPTGEELWTYIYATDGTDACYALLPQDDGGVIAGIAEGIWEENPYQYTRFTKIDAQGNEQWIIDSRNLFANGTYKAECLIQEGPNLIACGSFKQVGLSGYGKSKIIKFDFDGNLIWEREYGEYTDYNVYWETLTNIVHTCDNNYVAGGDWYTYTPTPNIANDDENRWDAYVVKLDRDTGEIIWERNFHYLDVPNDQQKLIDMKATLDGGIIFCGESYDATSTANANYEIEMPRRQGWLVKLDECGCLVPGCDTLCRYVGCAAIDTTAYFPPVANQFIVGPVPATQFINIYFAGGDLDLAQTQFQMYDLQGRLVYSFVPDAANTTYMLSTEKFASGTYVLHLSHNGAKVQEQKIIIAEQ